MSEETRPQVPAQHYPIIIVRKKGGHARHHGGAWKVAYADFVTAMMALFIVLWLLNTSQQVQKLVGGYFADPVGRGKNSGTAMRGSGETVSIRKDDMPKLKEQIENAMKELPQFQALRNQVQIIVTGEGLRIELLESESATFFESGRPEPTQKCREMLAMLATQLGMLPNKLLIEGHTDSHPFNSDRNYTNWELSADRANAARRLMEAGGLRIDQVAQVRGFADRNLRIPNDPENPSNRRVSVIVQYTAPGQPLQPPSLTKTGLSDPQKKAAGQPASHSE